MISLFLTPMLTMRLYSEERKTGTLELLLTAPVSDWEILLGKFLGALALYSGVILLVLLYCSLLFVYGNPIGSLLLPGVLGLVFFGGSLISLGMLFSTFTSNQIMPGSLTFGLFLLCMGSRLDVDLFDRNVFAGALLSFRDHSSSKLCQRCAGPE